MADEKLLDHNPSPDSDSAKPQALSVRSPEPCYSYRYPNGDGNGEINPHLQLGELWRKVRKHKWLILFVSAIITTVVTVEVYRTKSLYQALATVEIEKENRTLFRSGDVVIESEEADYGYYVSTAMKTKIKFLQTRPVLEDVVVSLKLDQDPNFMDVTERKSVWEAIKTIGGRLGPSDKSKAAPAPAQLSSLALLDDPSLRPAEESARLAPYVDVLAGGISATPVEDTRMLVISYQHTNPVLAASIANRAAEVFIRRSYQNKTQKFDDTSDWLDARTRELQSRVKQAEQNLADYTGSHNIFSTDGKENLTADKLSKLFDQATKAETELILKQSLYEEVKQGRAAQLPEAFADPKTAALQARLGELQTTTAQYRGRYGPDNPKTVDLQKQIAAVQQQIDDSRKQLEEKLKADYERTARDAQSLKDALEQAKAEAVHQNQSVIQFSILKQEVDTAKTLYTDFLQKTNQAKLQKADQRNNMHLIDPARVPVRPVSPNRPRTILIGFLISLALGLVLAFALEYLDDTIKTVDDVGRYTGLPALAVIPAVSARRPRMLRRNTQGKRTEGSSALSVNQDANGLANWRGPVTKKLLGNSQSQLAEAYRGLRTSVLLSTAGSPPKTILFTSSQPGEGKTTTTVNTAISLAQLGASVLLIDADLRRPTVHKIFGVDHARGLSTYLTVGAELGQLVQRLEVPNLSFLPCGPIPPNPAELISSDRMKELLLAASEKYDHVLIDSPPLINVTDPIILSTLVQGVILVVHGGQSRRTIVARARRELANVGAKIFGVVLNNVDLKSEGYDDYYYERYHSDYHSVSDKKAATGT